jgi:hypothetical protein
LGTVFKTLQLLYLIRLCSKIIRGANIPEFLLLHVKCLCTKIHSTPGMMSLYSDRCLSSEYTNIKIKNKKFVFNKKNIISKIGVTITLLKQMFEITSILSKAHSTPSTDAHCGV